MGSTPVESQLLLIDLIPEVQFKIINYLSKKDILTLSSFSKQYREVYFDLYFQIFTIFPKDGDQEDLIYKNLLENHIIKLNNKFYSYSSHLQILTLDNIIPGDLFLSNPNFDVNILNNLTELYIEMNFIIDIIIYKNSIPRNLRILKISTVGSIIFCRSKDQNRIKENQISDSKTIRKRKIEDNLKLKDLRSLILLSANIIGTFHELIPNDIENILLPEWLNYNSTEVNNLTIKYPEITPMNFTFRVYDHLTPVNTTCLAFLKAGSEKLDPKKEIFLKIFPQDFIKNITENQLNDSTKENQSDNNEKVGLDDDKRNEDEGKVDEKNNEELYYVYQSKNPTFPNWKPKVTYYLDGKCRNYRFKGNIDFLCLGDQYDGKFEVLESAQISTFGLIIKDDRYKDFKVPCQEIGFDKIYIRIDDLDFLPEFDNSVSNIEIRFDNKIDFINLELILSKFGYSKRTRHLLLMTENNCYLKFQNDDFPPNKYGKWLVSFKTFYEARARSDIIYQIVNKIGF